MRFGVEDDAVEIERLRFSKEQVEIFESLGEDEALHFIALVFRSHIGERGVTSVRSAIAHEVLEYLRAHRSILRLMRKVVQVVGRFDDLRPKMIGVPENTTRFIVVS